MSSKNPNAFVEPYYQVPKIVAEFDKMTNDHQSIFMHLYERLRQQKEWNKSNSELAVLARVGLTQLKHKLNDLEKWGFIKRQGLSFNRKFSLGEKFNTRSVSIPGQSQTRPESNPVLAGIDTSTGRPAGYIDKNSIKNISNLLANAIKPTKPKRSKHRKPTIEEQQDYYHNVPGTEWVGEYRKDMGLE